MARVVRPGGVSCAPSPTAASRPRRSGAGWRHRRAALRDRRRVLPPGRRLGRARRAARTPPRHRGDPLYGVWAPPRVAEHSGRIATVRARFRPDSGRHGAGSVEVLPRLDDGDDTGRKAGVRGDGSWGIVDVRDGWSRCCWHSVSGWDWSSGRPASGRSPTIRSAPRYRELHRVRQGAVQGTAAGGSDPRAHAEHQGRDAVHRPDRRPDEDRDLRPAQGEHRVLHRLLFGAESAVHAGLGQMGDGRWSYPADRPDPRPRRPGPRRIPMATTSPRSPSGDSYEHANGALRITDRDAPQRVRGSGASRAGSSRARSRCRIPPCAPR